MADYAYISVPLTDFQDYIMGYNAPGYFTNTFSDLTGYNLININIMAIPDNYLSVIDDKYYFPNSFQKNIP